jgi:hypothetical protein
VAGLAAALLIVGIVGFSGIGWQGWRAQKHLKQVEQEQAQTNAARRKAHQAVNDYFAEVSQNKLLVRPGLQPLRRDLLETALGYYQDFLREHGDDPATREEIAETTYRVAELSGQVKSKEESSTCMERPLSAMNGSRTTSRTGTTMY